MSPVNTDLFSIDKIAYDDGIISATIRTNPNSEILKGHFPGQPVVPGACMLQIVKEVLEDTLPYPVRLKKADHLKFMTIIDPANTLSVNLDIAYKLAGDTINVTAKLSNGDVVYFKFQGSFVGI